MRDWEAIINAYFLFLFFFFFLSSLLFSFPFISSYIIDLTSPSSPSGLRAVLLYVVGVV